MSAQKITSSSTSALVDAKIRAFDKDLPYWRFQSDLIKRIKIETNNMDVETFRNIPITTLLCAYLTTSHCSNSLGYQLLYIPEGFSPNLDWIWYKYA